MRLRPTGSKIHQVWLCPASAVLPQNTNEDKEARWEPARNKGKGVHRYLERVRVVGVAHALGEVPEDLLLLCKALDIDKLPTHLATEVAYAWNWRARTARELGRNLGHRDYDAMGVDWSCEVPGTYDVVGSGVDPAVSRRRAYLGDYKTGYTTYPRPGRFGQTMLGLLCATYVLECEDGIVELLRINDEGESYAVRDVVDAWDLQTFAGELEDVMQSLPGLEQLAEANGPGSLAKHEGPHCDHCAAFKDCSAKTALVRAVPAELSNIGARMAEAPMFDDKERELLLQIRKAKLPDALAKPAGKLLDRLIESRREVLEVTPGAITVRNAAAVWEAAERVEAICRRMREEVSGIAYHEPVTLSDGRVIERYTHKRRTVDGAIAAAVLERRYGRERALKAVNVKVSLDAIRECVVAAIPADADPRPKIETKKGDGLLDQVLSEIDKLGGLATSVGEECKPHQPRKLPPGSSSR